jgi:hypothetical protein
VQALAAFCFCDRPTRLIALVEKIGKVEQGSAKKRHAFTFCCPV